MWLSLSCTSALNPFSSTSSIWIFPVIIGSGLISPKLCQMPFHPLFFVKSHGLTRGNCIDDVLEISFLVRRNAHVSPLGEDQTIRHDGGRLLPYRDIDESPSGTNGSYGLVETSLYACCIERHIHAGAVAKLADSRDYVVFGGIEHIVGAELFRILPPSRCHLGDYDFFSTFGYECLDYCESDWPAAED